MLKRMIVRSRQNIPGGSPVYFGHVEDDPQQEYPTLMSFQSPVLLSQGTVYNVEMPSPAACVMMYDRNQYPTVTPIEHYMTR